MNNVSKVKVKISGTNLWLDRHLSLVDEHDAGVFLYERAVSLAKQYHPEWQTRCEIVPVPETPRFFWFKGWSRSMGRRYRVWVSARSHRRARELMRGLEGKWNTSTLELSPRNGRWKPVKEMDETVESIWIAEDERKRIYRQIL